MTPRRTTVVVDREFLAAAREALGTVTVRETVEEAFRAVIRGRARRAEIRALRAMDGLDLADASVRASAWRR